MTTDLQVLMARRIGEKISKLKGVDSCVVDDWSDQGSFRLFAKLQLAKYAACSRYVRLDDKQVNLRAISQSINCILQKSKVHKEHISCPHRHYWTPRGGGRRECDGYEDDAIQIDFAVPEGIEFQDIPKPIEVA